MQQKRKFKTKRAAQAEQLNERTGKIRQNAIRSNPSSERCKQDKSSRLFLKTPFPRHTFADNFPDVHNRQRRASLGRVIHKTGMFQQARDPADTFYPLTTKGTTKGNDACVVRRDRMSGLDVAVKISHSRQTRASFASRSSFLPLVAQWK